MPEQMKRKQGLIVLLLYLKIFSFLICSFKISESSFTEETEDAFFVVAHEKKINEKNKILIKNF